MPEIREETSNENEIETDSESNLDEVSSYQNKIRVMDRIESRCLLSLTIDYRSAPVHHDLLLEAGL